MWLLIKGELFNPKFVLFPLLEWRIIEELVEEERWGSSKIDDERLLEEGGAEERTFSRDFLSAVRDSFGGNSMNFGVSI